MAKDAGFEPFEIAYDSLGPAQVLHLYEPESELKAFLVVDNVACGPSVGGIRMAADVTVREVARLARAMTFKNAAAGLPHGGGKAGILAPAHTERKEVLIRSFARMIRTYQDYIPGPDMGTDESCMAWIQDEIGRAVGLPRVLGGIPLDELGATGFGLAESAEVASTFLEMDLTGATVVIEGFGNVGRHAARFLQKKGTRLVAASDTGGAVHDPEGLDLEILTRAKQESGSVTGYDSGQTLSQEELFALPCDILIPAARPDSIHGDNVENIQAKLILQGANIPATEEAEQRLYDKGVLNVPDFIANAGGVICASTEYRGQTESVAFEEIREKISRNTREVLERSSSRGIRPREAAMRLAEERVREAMSYRNPF